MSNEKPWELEELSERLDHIGDHLNKQDSDSIMDTFYEALVFIETYLEALASHHHDTVMVGIPPMSRLVGTAPVYIEEPEK